MKTQTSQISTPAQSSIRFCRETASDGTAIEALLDLCFGTGRSTKTVYRLRDGVPPVDALSFVARGPDGSIVGTIRSWPILVDRHHAALLLGPVAVLPALQGVGLGSQLIWRSLEQSALLGFERVILVGDEPYYRRFGFRRELALDLDLPGPVDPARLLALELVPDAMRGVAGMIGTAADPTTRAAALQDRTDRRRIPGLLDLLGSGGIERRLAAT